MLRQYQAKAAKPVENDLENLKRMGVRVLTTDLLRMSGRRYGEKIRHDPDAIAGIALDLAQQGRRAKPGLYLMNTTVIILAFGLGTRMRSKKAKVLHRAGGMALDEHGGRECPRDFTTGTYHRGHGSSSGRGGIAAMRERRAIRAPKETTRHRTCRCRV